MGSILYEYTPIELQELLDTSNSYCDILRKLGLNPKGGNPKTLKKIINEYNLDTTKLNENRSKLFSLCYKNMNNKRKTPLENIINGKSDCKIRNGALMKKIIDNGYKKYACEICGIENWMGKPLSLHLHHKDGNNRNNKLENLEILCPNCHSQTDNYAGKNVKKHKKIKVLKSHKEKKHSAKHEKKSIPISRDDLKNKIRTTPFTKIGKEFSVTDNAVRKWCDKYGLPRKVSDIKKIDDSLWGNI